MENTPSKGNTLSATQEIKTQKFITVLINEPDESSSHTIIIFL